MRYAIKKLNPLDMAVILLLFEGATFSVLGIVTRLNLFPGLGRIFQSVILGLLVGLFGTIIALSIWNNWNFKIRGEFSTKKFKLSKIDILQASILNSVFLIVLFVIQELLNSVRHIPTVGIALLGFLGVFLSLLVLFALYNAYSYEIGVHINNKHYGIAKISILTIAIMAGIYEAIILPLMAYFLSLPLPYLLSFAIAGLASGFIGGFVGTLIFNFVSPLLKPWIELR